jgi:integrase
MQKFLDGKALTSSRSIVDHLRWDLKSIFKMAESEGLVDFNPAGGLFTPPGKPEGEKLVLTPAEVRQALSVLDSRDRLIFRLAVFEGLRPGEILALRLGDVFDAHIEIVRRVYKGTFDTPKGRKGKRTARKAALSTGTAMELALWRTCLLKTGPADFCFHRSGIRLYAATTFGIGALSRSWRRSAWNGRPSRYCAGQTQVWAGQLRSTTRFPLISGATAWE